MININKKKIKPTTRYATHKLVKATNQYVEEEEDRLTNLPEPLKVHILSLLRLKQAIRTSALSKSWISLWTLIPNLDIDPYGSVTYKEGDFNEIVTKILDCRDKSVKLNKVTLHHYVSSSSKIWKTVFGYALSNGVKELIASIGSFENGGAWPDCLHDHTGLDSLTRLKLKSDTKISCRFLGQSSRSFKNLTNLYLRGAIITNNADSFSGFLALEKLTLCR
uniref:F-box/LRR-repeat protein At3g26922-like n=1 Tax=Erigeron canadensis TaxID=72917 RepID=UPI001CB8E9C3|nr:F-box/LRR-repeat protein At3g26922-like [Erigeron canadensis]